MKHTASMALAILFGFELCSSIQAQPARVPNQNQTLIGTWKHKTKDVKLMIKEEDGKVVAHIPSADLTGSVKVEGLKVTLSYVRESGRLIYEGKITDFGTGGAPTEMTFPKGLILVRVDAGSGAQPMPPVVKVKLTKEEKDLIDLLNAEREKKELPALTPNAVLMKVAKDHATQMAVLQKFSKLLNGKGVTERAQAAGYKASFIDDNICQFDPTQTRYGKGIPAIPQEAVPYMIKHATQKGRILSRDANEIGVAIVVDSKGKTWWNIIFAKR